MSKTLLFIGGDDETVPALKRAKELNYQVCVTDINPECAGIKWAQDNDMWFGYASTYSYEKTLKVVQDLGLLPEPQLKVNGVLAVACDVGPTVSYVAEHLGLPHIPQAISVLGQNKLHLKDWLKNYHIPTPIYTGNAEYTIIKPINGRGARNVKRVKTDEVKKYIKDIRVFQLENAMIVEDFIEGPQISSETIIWDGKCVFTGLTDRKYDYIDKLSPYVIENGGYGPSLTEGAPIASWIRETLQKLVDSLGIKSGTIKGDIVLDINNHDTPTIIECAIGRMSGGYSCTHYIPFAYGVDFLGAAFAVACGDNPSQYLQQIEKLYVVDGEYEMPGKPTNMNERGALTLKIKQVGSDLILPLRLTQ